ncbi:MAG TPA: DUF1345 domain-containing protein [Sphingobium sp.]|nr:DUF1345 domain-containing protein [Sphingobium sp.]
MMPTTLRKSVLPWRYGLFLLVFVSAVPFALLFDPIVGMMIGFDLAAAAFLATMPAVFAHGADQMRAHASRNDANRTLILLLTSIVTLVLLIAIASELRYGSGHAPAMLALIVTTLVLAWLFSNLVYTFHYAFLYYRKGSGGDDHGGLTIPGQDEPDYWDFAYFAFTLGMTFQTSDVEITHPVIRQVALFHCLAAFIFNLGIVAFTINILGS